MATTASARPRARAQTPRPRPGTRLPSGSRAQLDTTVRLLALVGLWASLLLVTYWWATGRGLQDLAGWETGLTSTGRLTGLLAADLLLIQVLLMARLPMLERAFGQDRLAHIHRLVGLTSFSLMLAHVVLITWGYAAGQLDQTPATFWQLTIADPGMLLAVAGTGCLVMVVVTSIKAARRSLRYESWHLLHLYAYLGVGLALPHELWTGQDFIGSTGRTVFWWGLWIASVGALLIWRVGLPLWRSARHGIRAAAVVDERNDFVSVYLTTRPARPIQAEAGQFFTFRFLTGRGWTRAHPYSLSAAPDGRHLRITAKIIGDGSAALRAVRPGTRVLVEGPFGRLTERARTRTKVAFIGAGIGITPLRALAESMPYQPGDAILLYRYLSAPLFDRELRILQARRGLEVVLLPGHRRTPASWLGDGPGPVDDLTVLTSWIPDVAERDVYVCGPEGWTDRLRGLTRAAGLPAERFHVETFRW